MTSENLKELVGQIIQRVQIEKNTVFIKRVQIEKNTVFIKTPDSVFILEPSKESYSFYNVAFEAGKTKINLNIDSPENKVKDAQFSFGVCPDYTTSVVVAMVLTNLGEVNLTWLFKPLKNGLPLPEPVFSLRQYKTICLI